MTTIAEVKRWTLPLVQADARLRLIGRNLVLTPVGHFVRGVYVDRTSSRLRSHLLFYVHPLFSIPGEGRHFMWSRQQPTFETDDPRFEANFLDLCREGLHDLSRIRTIDDFLEQSEMTTSRSFGNVPISHFPLIHAVVLGAVGRFEDALNTLGPTLREEDARWNRILAQEQAELGRKPKSAMLKDSISRAMWHLRSIADLKPLLALLEADDHAGLAVLLRSHEQHNAKLWGVEHLWRPEPFPFEQIAS